MTIGEKSQKAKTQIRLVNHESEYVLVSMESEWTETAQPLEAWSNSSSQGRNPHEAEFSLLTSFLLLSKAENH